MFLLLRLLLPLITVVCCTLGTPSCCCVSVFFSSSLSRDGGEFETASGFSQPHHKGSGKHVIPVASLCTNTCVTCTHIILKPDVRSHLENYGNHRKICIYIYIFKLCERANPQQWSKPVHKVVAYSPAITVVHGRPHVRFVLRGVTIKTKQQQRLNVASHSIKSNCTVVPC